MFIYSVRASTVKFFGFIALVLVLLVAVVMSLDGNTVYASASGSSVKLDGMSSDEARLEFLKQFGIKVDEESLTSEAFKSSATAPLPRWLLAPHTAYHVGCASIYLRKLLYNIRLTLVNVFVKILHFCVVFTLFYYLANDYSR